MIANKIPPQALEIEKAVLSAILLNGKAIDKIALCPEDFYSTAHQQIFKGLINCKHSVCPVLFLLLIPSIFVLKKICGQ
ncbi:MAG: DnaB-like helicase N-terminal domain-containing protein [Fermentimonas sp.]|nr:DnaB-like helicase N-terminal domain-containing protein [Fermentimonas sp.]MDD3188818.1 DnaB-like helicase N-terminal domain-containing protein [Fermentimonas sp.]